MTNKEKKAQKKAQKQEDARIAKETHIRNVINYNRVVAIELANRAKEKKANPGSFICLQKVNKIYDNLVQAVFDFSLDVKKNEFIVLVGPSGCGKSTTLRMIAGLEEITAGNLFIDNSYANVLPPKDRDIAMVFQSYALYPHMSVYNNMAFAMQIRPYYIPQVDQNGNPVMGYDQEAINKYTKIKKELTRELDNFESYGYQGGSKEVAKELSDTINTIDEKLQNAQNNQVQLKKLRKYNKSEIEDFVIEAAKILQIEEYLNRKPRELSGGQRQRVALGRAIVKKSKLFLMDEPLSNLDAKLRVSMRSEIKRIHKSIGATTIYVTHDQTEAMTMADRIVIMNKGYIQQTGTPQEIYNKPANVFVATFIGSPAMNIYDCTLENNNVIFPDGMKLKVPAVFTKNVKEAYQAKIDQINNWVVNGLEDEREKQKLVNKETLILKMKQHKAKGKNSDVDPLDNITLTEDEEKICSDLFNSKLTENNEKRSKYEEMISKESYAIKFGIRPENVYVDGASLEKDVQASEKKEITISISELLGNEYYLHGDLGKKDFILKSTSSHPVAEGEKTNIIFDLNKAHIFDPIDDIIIF